jgi:hypothetical protein
MPDFLFPFRGHTDLVSSERNDTALEDYLRNWAQSSNDSDRWSHPGFLHIKEGELEITWDTDIEISEVESRVKVAPTGSVVTVDVHVNDTTTLFTIQGDRPEIAVATKAAIGVPAITLIGAGDRVRVDIDEQDSNNVAQGLTVTVRYRRV